MKKKLLISFFLYLSLVCNSQTLNAYAKVTNINGAKTTLTVSNVNEASHTFTVGGSIIVMQMQDNVIGTNTTNISSFGDVGSIANAGIYEILTISSRSPATGTPTTITLSSSLTNNFNTGANSSVQIITLRDLGANYTTTANITGLAWNGNIGGVIAIQVTNTLTLNHSITADAIGFRRGNFNSTSLESACTPSLYITNAVTQAFKGEGIYKATDPNFVNARGKIINGGGGGNDDNGGGGGGGNYSAGGTGGFGWTCSAANISGGIGGIALSPYISANRIFMGGGGGGGQQNNNLSTNGGNGGGIILVKANTIKTNTVCGSSIKISANGEATSNSGNDGAGGAGAAGSIVLQVTNYAVNAACPLTITANGGNGGSVGNSGSHGGGAGGGQGVVIFSISQPTVNITTTTNNGLGGANSSSGGATTAGNGGGVNNGGVFNTSSGALPVELIYFNAISEGTYNSVDWKSMIEVNFKHYELESSEDGINFTKIATVNPIGNVSSINSYNYLDFNPYSPITYYRLKMVDLDYSFEYSRIISIENGTNKTGTLVVFPNPATNELYIKLSVPNEKNATIDIKDILGRVIYHQEIDLTQSINNNYINTANFASGTYIVSITAGNSLSENIKVVINKN